MSYISISQLSAIEASNITNSDLLLVSRIDTSLGLSSNPAISYKLNALDFESVISNDVKNKLANSWCISVENMLSSNISTQLNIMHNNISTLTSNMNILSIRLTSEWFELSSKLTTDYNNLCLEFQRLSGNLYTEFEEFKDEIYSYLSNKFQEISINLKNDMPPYDDMINALSDWVSQNFVNISGVQTIYGEKTFTQDIIGTALSAKWS